MRSFLKKILKSLFKLSLITIILPSWVVSIFLLWFIPWVFVFHLGILVYFPYYPSSPQKIENNKIKDSFDIQNSSTERFMRVTGPLTNFLTDNWASVEKIPSSCFAAALASEDTKFYEHHGIDLESIEKNLIKNAKASKIKSGASTITQQLVKNAFLSREKSYVRKSREIIGAIILNLMMTKKEQLTWYLNIIEFGPKIYGIKQAAQYYFNIAPHQLSPSQCISLMVILPSPNNWNKSLVNKRPTRFFMNRYYKILRRMRQMNLVNYRDLKLAQNFKY